MGCWPGAVLLLFAFACATPPEQSSVSLEQVVAHQQARIESQEHALVELRKEVEALRTAVAVVNGLPPAAPAEQFTAQIARSDALASARGAGSDEPAAVSGSPTEANASSANPSSAKPQPLPGAEGRASSGGASTAQAEQPQVAEAVDAPSTPEQPGENPAEKRERDLEQAIPPRVGGVLLGEGRLQLEPQVRYAYSSVNQVQITGYTILPAITLGVLDITQRHTSSFTTQLGIRYGILDWLEMDFGIPFIAGWSRTSFAPQNTSEGDGTISVKADGYDIGDIRFGLRAQLNKGTTKMPSFVAGLSARFPTGTDPYDVSRTSVRDDYLETELPTSSGFYGLVPTLSFVYPTEPAVVFGNVRYTWNIERNITAKQFGGDPADPQPYGKIDAGDVIGASLGVGLSLNDSLSVMASYDHSVVFKTSQNGSVVQGSTVLQIGTLGIGGTWRSSSRTSYNLFVGIGVTDDAPDVSVGLRVPITFDLY